MKRRFFLGLLGAWAACCTFSHAAGHSELTARNLSQFTPISEGIRRAASLTLYQGLPHPVWEARQYKEELSARQIVRLHGFPFYKRPVAVAAHEIEPLRQLSAADDSYWSYAGAKLCGGYHPDYCLEWKDGETFWQLLICFGCHEMKLYGPKTELIVDIRNEAFTKFQTALNQHLKQRPKSE